MGLCYHSFSETPAESCDLCVEIAKLRADLQGALATVEAERMRAEAARAEVEHWREARRNAVAGGDILKEELRRANLQIDAIRIRCGRICDESTIALDKAATDGDRKYWGARLRCALEIVELVGTGTEKRKCSSHFGDAGKALKCPNCNE